MQRGPPRLQTTEATVGAAFRQRVNQTASSDFYTWSPPSEGWTPAESAHIMSPVHQWCTDPGWGAHTCLYTDTKPQPPPPHVPVAPEPGHLAQGSKAVCRSNQSSQWVTPLIQFYFISGEQTTRGVCTFLGSRSNPISQWPEIRL